MAMETRGPKAPKDPTKKRQGFYIMYNKEICANPKEDGTGVVPIYEDGGRLISSAKIIGGISDEEELDLLKTAEGLKKLVHSIGVSIDSSESDEEATFVFQIYGKTDTYGGGANMIMPVKMDGMEYVLNLSDVEWKDDDKEPGQIRFEFKKAGTKASVSVMLYLNDGFSAPLLETDDPVDFESDAYKAIIEKSLMNQGNNYRLKKAIDKARAGLDTTIAFIGGSITQGAGAVPINSECYARKTFEGFCDLVNKGYDENVHYIKAGVGGTPSELGMLRYKRDILDEGTPDIVVVEFAVNDEGDETKGDCYDSLVRKIYNGPGKPAVMLIFAVFADDFNLQDRLKVVGESYDLPMASTKDSVIEQFYQSKEDGRIVSKRQYFYDCFHPTNIGHRIMADGLINLMKKADAAEYDDEKSIDDIKPPKSADFENVLVIDRIQNEVGAQIGMGDFTDTDKEIQCVERNMDLFASPQFPNNFMYKGTEGRTNKPFTMDVCCRHMLLIFKDSADNKDGIAEVFVDGQKVLSANPKEVGWIHCNPVIILRSNESKNHHVEIKMAPGCENKDFTILGFGIVK